MSTPRKHRSDSWLKTQPEDVQLEIYELCNTKGLAEAQSWVAQKFGKRLSKSRFSDFWGWYGLRLKWRRQEVAVESLLEEQRRKRPDISEGEIFDMGQRLFGVLAIEEQDPKTWRTVQQLNQKRQEIRLDQQRFQRETAKLFVKWAEDQRALEIAQGAGSAEDKTERLGKLIFGEDWK